MFEGDITSILHLREQLLPRLRLVHRLAVPILALRSLGRDPGHLRARQRSIRLRVEASVALRVLGEKHFVGLIGHLFFELVVFLPEGFVLLSDGPHL